MVTSSPTATYSTRSAPSGLTDARISHALARLRGKNDITFGVWCEIIRPDVGMACQLVGSRYRYYFLALACSEADRPDERGER